MIGKLSLFGHPDEGSLESELPSDAHSNAGRHCTAGPAQLPSTQIRTRRNNNTTTKPTSSPGMGLALRSERHEEGYSSPPACLLANLSPDCRSITSQKETEHSASQQEEFSVSREIWAGSTRADEIATNTLSASLGILQCVGSPAYG